MGREIKRVPLNFDGPLDTVWQGYLMPDKFTEDPCPDCENGATDAYEWLMKVAYVIAGLADDVVDEARGRSMHPYLKPLLEISYGQTRGRPGTQFAEFADGIAPEAGGGPLGRDVYRVQRALVKAAGLTERWGYCPTCDGDGSLEAYEGQRAEAEAWECTEPPEGEGWQLWETVSEGSPITPVFATPEELATYMVNHHWGSQSDPMASSFEVAMNFIRVGWAPSGVISSAGVQTGVEAVGRIS